MTGTIPGIEIQVNKYKKQVISAVKKTNQHSA